MTEEVKEQGTETLAEEKPLDKLTVPELKEIAAKIPGATDVTAMKKEALLALIKKHRGIDDNAAGKKEASSHKTLKSRLFDLRALKEAKRKEKNKKEVDILRRRINRLKKKTRRAG